MTEDMYKWFQQLDNFQIISKESIEFLFREGKKESNIQAPLGYCRWKEDDVIEHSHHGSSASYGSLVEYYKEDRLMIILMTNQKHGNVHERADVIYDWVSIEKY